VAPAISELGDYQVVEARGQVEVFAVLYGDSVSLAGLWVLGETKGDGEEHNIDTKRKTSDWMMTGPSLTGIRQKSGSGRPLFGSYLMRFVNIRRRVIPGADGWRTPSKAAQSIL
jgi:hypothetical protein